MYNIENERKSLKYELEYEEYQCKSNKFRNRERMNEIKRRIAEIDRKLEIFYNDPMTEACGLY